MDIVGINEEEQVCVSIILKLLRIPVSVIMTYTIIALFCRKLYSGL